MPRHRPPFLAKALLRFGLSARAGEVVVGDLEEEYAEIVVPRVGSANARQRPVKVSS